MSPTDHILVGIVDMVRSFFASDRRRLDRLRAAAVDASGGQDLDALEIVSLAPAWTMDRLRIAGAMLAMVAAVSGFAVMLERAVEVPGPVVTGIQAVLYVSAMAWAARRSRRAVVARRGDDVLVIAVPEFGPAEVVHQGCYPQSARAVAGWRWFPHYEVGDLRLGVAALSIERSRSLAVAAILGLNTDDPTAADRVAGARLLGDSPDAAGLPVDQQAWP